MNLDKFTIKSQEAIQQSQQLAVAAGHQSIEPAHLLLAILQTDENVLPYILKKSGVNPDKLQSGLDELVRSYPKVDGARQYLSDDANKALQKAMSMALKSGDEFVSIEHLLLGILEGKEKAARFLRENGLNEKDVSSAIQELRKGERG